MAKLKKDLTSLLVQSQAKKRFVGLSVLVVVKQPDGNFAEFKQHMGYRDHGQTKAPDDDTIYEIGSISKVLTRLAVASQSLVKPEDVLSQHLPPDIRSPRPNDQEYTIEDLMTHTGFIVEHPCTVRASDPKTPVCHGVDMSVGFKDPYGKGSRSSTYDFVLEYSYSVDEFPWSYPSPGTFRTYSNVGIGLVGELVAQAHDVSYEHYLKTKILHPLGMMRTQITMPCVAEQSCTNLADPHLFNPENGTWQPWSRFNMPGLPGAGAVRSSLSDMGKFLRANLTPEGTEIADILTQGQAPLSDVTVKHNSNICKKGETPRKNLCNADKLLYNYAWQPRGVDQNYLYHGGRTTGSEAMILFTQDRSAGAVVLKNGSQIAVTEDTRYHLPDLVARCALQMIGKISKDPQDACLVLKLK